MEKKLYRSRANSMIAGVCGGLGEYLNVDPTIIRVVAVLLIFAKGIGLLAYLIGWIIIPRRSEMEAEAVASEEPEYSRFLPGLALIVIGLVFLLNNLVPWFGFGYLWPLVLIVLGVALLLKSQKREAPS
ncbi:MAG: PspC domain-containing protein [candidate division Zixibacteria bacterium]|nr:PspC domain-containing protein [candidate division Zixibacteria bacterium]